MTITPEQEALLQEAFNEAMERVCGLTGVLGFACVVVSKDAGPCTLYAGDRAVVSAGMDLLFARFDEDGIEDEIAEMIEEASAEAIQSPTSTRH